MTLNKPTVLKQHGHLVSPSIADWKSKLEGVCVCVCVRARVGCGCWVGAAVERGVKLGLEENFYLFAVLHFCVK